VCIGIYVPSDEHHCRGPVTTKGLLESLWDSASQCSSFVSDCFGGQSSQASQPMLQETFSPVVAESSTLIYLLL
jgi:hypothetical protein